MDNYQTPKSKVEAKDGARIRPLWLSITIVIFALLILPLVFAAIMNIIHGGSNIFSAYAFLAITVFSIVGLVGLWLMKMWGVSCLVVGYLVYAVTYTFGGGSILGFPQATFPLIYLMLYLFFKQELRKVHRN